MWRSSVNAEHVQLFFAVDAAIRHVGTDGHAQIRSKLAELRTAIGGTPKTATTAAAQLIEACAEVGLVPTARVSLPGQSRTDEQGAQEVVPGLWIGPLHPAETRSWFEAAKVTHVVDATGGWRRVASALESGWERREPCFADGGASYLVLDAKDEPGFPLDGMFARSTAFIEAALARPGGVVLVHCHSGVSRSATLVMAFLMSRHGLSAQEARSFPARPRVVSSHLPRAPEKGALEDA